MNKTRKLCECCNDDLSLKTTLGSSGRTGLNELRVRRTCFAQFKLVLWNCRRCFVIPISPVVHDHHRRLHNSNLDRHAGKGYNYKMIAIKTISSNEIFYWQRLFLSNSFHSFTVTYVCKLVPFQSCLHLLSYFYNHFLRFILHRCLN